MEQLFKTMCHGAYMNLEFSDTKIWRRIKGFTCKHLLTRRNTQENLWNGMTHFQQGGCGMSHREKKKFTHNFSKETW